MGWWGGVSIIFQAYVDAKERLNNQHASANFQKNMDQAYSLDKQGKEKMAGKICHKKKGDGMGKFIWETM